MNKEKYTEDIIEDYYNKVLFNLEKGITVIDTLKELNIAYSTFYLKTTQKQLKEIEYLKFKLYNEKYKPLK